MLMIIGLQLLQYSLWACPLCERQQPKLFRGITHGAGPESNWDYIIVWVTVAIVLVTLFFSIKWLIKPGERSEHHIKRFILNNENHER
ncbi:hypothetical protein GCM10023231_20800 [Olivibacter ginsenosidimutans]|uniref:Uncharacterized protein n=2 Tax=Olivibacter ginsenosidimutans TaxID=1176537 RepID=A0ABP9B9G8_9SPHI